MNTKTQKLKPFTLEFDNLGGGSDKLFMIGDPLGINLFYYPTYSNAPDVVGSPAYAKIKDTLASAPVDIEAIEYKTSSDSSQFSKNFYLLTGDIGDSSSKSSLVPFVVESLPVSDQPLTVMVNFKKFPVVLNSFNSIGIDVMAGEKATLTFIPRRTWGR